MDETTGTLMPQRASARGSAAPLTHTEAGHGRSRHVGWHFREFGLGGILVEAIESRATLLLAGAGTVAVSAIGLVAYASLPAAVKRGDHVV
jgi:hypothetical protein